MVRKMDNKNANLNDKFDNAFKNFKYVKTSGIAKFEKIDNWLEKEAKQYKSEVENERKRFTLLKRGTIVKVDFGVNPGSELCHTHFAIVLSKFDNIRQETVTVIPLTSKPGVGRLPLDNLIRNEIINNIKTKEITEDNRKEIFELLKEYKKYKELSYAYVSQITTISKSRLIFSKNKYDIINKTRCSSDILNKIDDAIISSIIGKKIVSLKELEETFTEAY